MIKRSFTLAGHRTSVALETEFWAVLDRHAAECGKPTSALVAAIDAERAPEQSLASRLRIAALAAAGTAGRSRPFEECVLRVPDHWAPKS